MNQNENEKSPFLGPQNPVSLTPSWEAQKLPNDELNFKGMTLEKAKMSLKPPKDKMKIVFFIFLLHGLGTLMPWNMFINAKSYFINFKLGSNDGNTSSIYASNFMTYIGFASQIPNFVFNWLNIFVNMSGDLNKRIVCSILLELVIFVVTVLLAILDSSNWQDVFFWVTIISVVLLNMANGIYQNTIYGMVAALPIKYTGAVVLGSNISGLFASIADICSTYIFSSHRTSAIYYFITAMIVLLVCFDTYFALPLNKFYRYYEVLRRKEEKTLNTIEDTKVPLWTVFKQAFPQLFNIFFTFFITLSVFPAIYSGGAILIFATVYNWSNKMLYALTTTQLYITGHKLNVAISVYFTTMYNFSGTTDHILMIYKALESYEKYIKANSKDFIIPTNFFTSITCFLTFNLFAMLGSLTTSWIQWPKPKFLWIPVIMRVVFLPLFLFCNYLPLGITRTLPVLITNEWAYWIIGMAMSYSSGYLSSLGMMYAPQMVLPKHQITAGMFAAAMLITGILSGILFSPIFSYLI